MTASEEPPAEVVAAAKALGALLPGGPSSQLQPYALCLTEGCGAELADREAMSQHLADTHVRPSNAELFKAGGVLSTSHRCQVVNPTPEERQVQRVRGIIDSALDDFYEQIDRDVQNEVCTEEEVKEQLRFFDLEEGWTEYVTGSEG